jgi:hypothetical protein
MRHWDGRERRQTTAEVARIDLRRLRRGEWPVGGRAFPFELPGHGCVGILIRTDAIEVLWGDPQVRQPVKLIWVKLRYGYRPYLRCPNPRCGRRVLVLYPRLDRWGCVKCCGLAFRSQLELVRRRGEMAAHRIQKRLAHVSLFHA